MTRLGTTFLLGLGLVAACTSAPLTLPGPIMALDDRAATRSAILEGMSARGWVVEQESQTRILARLHVRHHVAKVWIDYSGERIEFAYAGSDGLGCDSAEPTSCGSIHRNYNRWARNLALDISRELSERRALDPGDATGR